MERHVHDPPAPEGRAVFPACRLEPPDLSDNVKRLPPGAEHLTVGICLNVLLRDLRQGGQERLPQGRSALR